MPKIGESSYFAVINTQEQPIEVLHRLLGNLTDNEDGSVTTESGELYVYDPIEVAEMPLSELTVYEYYPWCDEEDLTEMAP